VTACTGSDGKTVLTVENNGDPMTYQILTEKLLSLGGSGKNCEGTVGGFGRAKELLYYCHDSYQITTGHYRVVGSGASYDLDTLADDDATSSNGTRSEIVMDGDLAETMRKQFLNFISLSEWHGTFVLNGEVIAERLSRGKARKDLEFGTVYTNKGQSKLLVVRINGTPMFTRYLSYDKCVVVELNGKSSEVLQSSRDYLKYEYGNELDNFVVELTVDKKSALKSNRPTIEKTTFSGYKLKGRSKLPQAVTSALQVQMDPDEFRSLIAGIPAGLAAGMPPSHLIPSIKMGGREYAADTSEGHIAAALINMVRVTSSDGTMASPTNTATVRRREIPMRPEFILKNETGMKIPDYFTPEKFSAYSKGLIWRWMGSLVTLADIYGTADPFSVGFLFTEDGTEAQHELTDDGMHIMYIKPVTVVRHDGKSPVLKARWSLTGVAIWDLVSYAAHEFVHYLGYSMHDECYAGKLTEVLAVCLKERVRFAKVFQTKVEWPDAG
jgi:hypothetical protein